MSGGRVVVELMYCDFLGRAGDEVFNQLAKWQAMSAGVLSLPLVLRVSVGFRYGAQHSQEWSAMVSHIPGLKVYYPVTAYDAKGMLNLALRGTDPVIFFESQQLYGMAEELHPEGVPAGYYEIDEGAPHIHRHGGDMTILTIGATLYKAIEAAQILSEHYGVEAEVIDARFVTPLDYGPIVDSVRKTGRLLLTSDACERGSFLHNIATNISRLCFDDLDGPPVVLGSRNWITPPAELESVFFPQADWILDAIHEQILPLQDHQPRTLQNLSELSRRSAAGV
jgi:2-oxoisovalerate dehydrogenase E1 component